MSHICSKPQISVWISRPGLTGEPVFPGIPYPSIPSGSCRHGVGSLCLNRALRSCSADPLPPGSATLTFLLPSVLCCPQTPTAPARIPAAPPSASWAWLPLCLIIWALLDTSSWRGVPPARPLSPSGVVHFSPLQLSLPRVQGPAGGAPGSGNSQINSLHILLLGY